jgi:hypothetical protein
MKTFSGLLTLFFSLPIWFYLLYKILVAVNATEVMWFLFWAYIPVATVANVIGRITEKELK